MHLSEGEIRAYQDQELSPDLLRHAQAHLETCPRCQARVAASQAVSQRVSAHLAALEPAPFQAPIPAKAGHARMKAQLTNLEKEKQNMWQKLTSRISRPVWATLAVIAILMVSLAFAPVRAIASSFLSMFRVEQIKVVQVNPADFQNKLGSSSQLEDMLSKSVQVDKNGEPKDVTSAAEASQLAGISVVLPADSGAPQKFVVQPSGTATMTVDLKLVQAVLTDLGRTDIKLPAALDGAVVKVEIPASVVAMYGDCQFDKTAAAQAVPEKGSSDLPRPDRLSNCTTFMQMSSPSVSAPPGLDLSQIGEAYLQVLGMTADEAASFARNVDWATTFVVPIPRDGAQYQDVQVDGVTGTFIQFLRSQHKYALVWVKDGILYTLSGPGDVSAALNLAGSLK